MEVTDRVPPRRSLLQAFIAHIAGRGRLSTAWWGFGIGGSVIYIVVLSLVGLFLMTRSVSEDGATVENQSLQLFLSRAGWTFLTYQILVAILVWRNAFNVGNPIWGWVARAMLIVGFAGLIFRTESPVGSWQ